MAEAGLTSAAEYDLTELEADTPDTVAVSTTAIDTTKPRATLMVLVTKGSSHSSAYELAAHESIERAVVYGDRRPIWVPRPPMSSRPSRVHSDVQGAAGQTVHALTKGKPAKRKLDPSGSAKSLPHPP